MLIFNISDLGRLAEAPAPPASRAWASLRAAMGRSLSQISQAMRDSAGELAMAQCKDTGKPIRYCYSELDRCFFQIENALAFLENWRPETTPKEIRERGFSVRQYLRYAPVGSVLAITTFSSPYSSFFQKFLPSLIAQNKLYFKPSPRARASSALLYELVHGCLGELGDLLHCLLIPDSQAGALLDRRFDAVLFTGKSETARIIKQRLGRARGVFETGSNALAYVDKSASLDDLPQKLIADAFSQSGMRCIGLKNLFVHRAVAEPFIQELAAAAKVVPYGDHMDMRTVVGPVMDGRTLEALIRNIRELTAKGYRMLAGGEVEAGNLLQPTVLLGGMDTPPALQEAYGPLLCVYPVNDCAAIPEDCLRRSSINTSIYATEPEVIESFASRCRNTTATICVNYGPALRMDSLPFGGVADENEGREDMSGLVEFLSREQLLLVACDKGERLIAEQKPWDWKAGAGSFWLEPSEDVYFLAARWKEKKYKTVLDLGSGLGRHAVYFSQQGFQVKALDLSVEGIAHLRQWAGSLGLDILTAVGHMDALPYPEAAFDCVFAMNVIYHADKAGVLKAIDEIDRVLKPGGEFFITFCAKDTPAFAEGRYPRVDEYTVLKTEAPEADVPHFFVDLSDIQSLLARFGIDRARHTEDCLFEGKPVNLSRHFSVLGRKKGREGFA